MRIGGVKGWVSLIEREQAKEQKHRKRKQGDSHDFVGPRRIRFRNGAFFQQSCTILETEVYPVVFVRLLTGRATLHSTMRG